MVYSSVFIWQKDTILSKSNLAKIFAVQNEYKHMNFTYREGNCKQADVWLCASSSCRTCTWMLAVWQCLISSGWRISTMSATEDWPSSMRETQTTTCSVSTGLHFLHNIWWYAFKGPTQRLAHEKCIELWLIWGGLGRSAFPSGFSGPLSKFAAAIAAGKLERAISFISSKYPSTLGFNWPLTKTGTPVYKTFLPALLFALNMILLCCVVSSRSVYFPFNNRTHSHTQVL